MQYVTKDPVRDRVAGIEPAATITRPPAARSTHLTRPPSGLSPALLAAAASALVLASARPAQAQPWPVTLRATLARLGEIEWRLGTAAGRTCPVEASSIGVTFDDRRAYRREDWPLLAETLGMAEGPVIAATATGGPARLAGLEPGDVVRSIGGIAVERIAGGGNEARLAADRLAAHVAALPEQIAVIFEVQRAGRTLSIEIVPERRCAARIVLEVRKSIGAHSDGRNISVSTGLVDFARNDDEIALLAGHELAHVIHRDGKARSVRERRAMEDAADLQGAHLARCAGYDASAALDFWTRYKRADGLAFLRGPSHRSPGDRVERMRAFLATDHC